MTIRQFFANGVDGSTGHYLLPPQEPKEVAKVGLREKLPAAELQRLESWLRDRNVEEDRKKNLRIFDGNAKDLGETGWAVVFGPDVDEAVVDALGPLLDHRKAAATRYRPGYFKVFRHEAGQSAEQFLAANGVRPDAAVDPDRGVPYYLLLVGCPESIPFQFQYELDVSYGVGRIHFDRPEQYRQYAESVVAAETRPRRPKKLALFGVRNANDCSTQQTADDLVSHLQTRLGDTRLDWSLDAYLGPQAERARLARLLGRGEEAPALLFTASHGVGFPLDDERQRERQGAILCQDWPGPCDEEGVQREHYFTAEDLKDDADVHGMVVFLFACYSGGTPARDDFYDERALGKPRRLAEKAFVSRLCQRLLSHPKGGALAVVGHIDRAWTCSFRGSERGEGTDNYFKCLRRLLDGHTVSWAMEYFNVAHAVLATRLSNRWEAQQRLEDVDLEAFAELWLENNDARNFVVFGDPAVKLSKGRKTFRDGGLQQAGELSAKP